MTTYGFRVYALMAHFRGAADSPLPWDLDGLRLQFADAADELVRLGTRFGRPRAAEPSPTEDVRHTVTTLTLSRAEWVTDNHLHLMVGTGDEGRHSRGRRRTGIDIELEDASAEADHRVDIFFPDGSAADALLVTETIGSRDPVRLLCAYISYTQQQRVKAAKETDRQIRAEARARGEKAAKSPERRALYLRHERVADAAHIRRIIDTANRAEAVFTEHATRSASGRDVREKELRIGLHTPGKRSTAVDAVTRWADRRRQGKEPEGVAVLQADLDLDASALDDLGLHFDEVAVVLGSSGEGTRKFTPAHVDEAFTYYVANGQTSMMYYYQRVIPKVRELAVLRGTPVNPPSAQEVATCLIDSTSDRSLETPGEDSGSGDS